ncbi:chemotaxis protein CheW [Salinadaptatus halalkaliphilus]|uniref:Chemotaxis protein CheW n=1 Tax=Salinadaptatus halalkaliphilus TaxID=2419781 RepID=A0A4S3THY1_9EURY|nr:chemotaxis protein CheW [Salinadaptatus halalkaliphilus]THE63644.1 chemotaxis protein CheW [Salinadaptatus halalkaliphilus]
MTDDRARRIRDLRNRRSSDGDDEQSGDAPDEGDAGTTDEEAVPDGNGSATEDDAAGDAETAAEDSDAVAENTEAEDDSDDDPSHPGETESAAGSSTDEQPAPPSVASEPVSSDGSASTDAGDELTFDESSIPAADAAEPTVSDHEASPMVDSQQSAESAFGGAIADASIMSEFVDDIGDEATADAAAVADTEGYGAGAAGRGAAVFEQGDSLVASTHDDDDTIQMLEFYLNDSRYAVEIEQISAIVEMKEITRFPRGPDAIDGVTDLRGEITAVLDPTVMLDIERNERSDDQYIVVLERDDDKQKLGVRVTDVSQAVTYRTSQIDETASVMDAAEEHEFINGIIKKSTDDRTELVTWLDTATLIEHTG